MIDVILPVLNESRSIPWVVDRFPEWFSPIVVDNGSTDGSAQIAQALGARVVREPQRGFGAACFAGLLAATTEIVCFMDCDGSLDPSHLPEVTNPVLRDDAELVVGARVAAPGAWPLHARVGNHVLARKIRRKAGVALRDLGPMRATKRAALLSLGLTDRRFGWPLEMVIKAAEAGWRIREVNVPYLPRHGASKVTGTVSGTLKTIRDMSAVLR